MKIYKFLLGLLLALLVSWSAGNSASAQSLLTYPIPELGFCRDAKECSLYCDIPENHAACWSYEKYVLGSRVLGSHDEVSDEEIEAKAARLGITFPIAELGGCVGASDCRAYCDNPNNFAACDAFATRHGFNREEPEEDFDSEKEELLGLARDVLGCDSYEACEAYCESHQDACLEFVRIHAPQYYDEHYEQEDERLDAARGELGCDSFETCRAYCDDPANQDRCQAFAERHFDEYDGDRDRDYDGRDVDYGPLPCDTPESCELYCRENVNEPACSGAFNGNEYDDPGSYEGETQACETEEECQRWCEQNPDTCPGYIGSQDYEEYQYDQDNGSSFDGSYPEDTQYYYEDENYNQFEEPYSSPNNETYDGEYVDYPEYTDGTSQGEVEDPAAYCAEQGCDWTSAGCFCN